MRHDVEQLILSVSVSTILPRYQSLTKEEIRTKTGPGDLVTIADEEAEQKLAEGLVALLPGSTVIGEEAVAADPAVLDHLSRPGAVWIIDPIDGTANFVAQNNSAYAFHGTIVAREAASSGTECAAWKVEGLIRREANAGTTVLVNSATTVLDNTPNWGMVLSANTSLGCLKIEVTGAAKTIRWVATIHTSEITYA
ncbi:MAG: hypothetical protein GKS03_17240 [Alphaproteobacteria bacterium]|nr:hypothetical protein [Alphaproteobacteria bacterium]